MELKHQDRALIAAVFVAVLAYVGWVAYGLVTALV